MFTTQTAQKRLPVANTRMPATLLCWLVICLGHFFNAVAAQEVFTPKPAKLLTRFHFEMLTGGIIILHATINNHPDSLNFILDTGSGGISLDSATVEALKLPRTKSDRTIRGIAGIRTVDYTNHNTLKLPGLVTDSLNFHINDYDLLTGVYGMKIDGIIGFSFLRRYIVKLNYDKYEIEVYSPGTMRYPGGGHVLHPAISGLPMQYAKMREQSRQWLEGRFYLDTGAGLCFLLSNEFATDSSIFAPKKKRYATIAEGLGGKKTMELTIVKEVKVGPYRFRKVPTYVFEDEFNVTAYPHLGGLIGNDLLRRFNVIINYPRSEFHLTPNSHYHDVFDYSYHGLAMYFISNEIVITDIMPGSPAEKAGLKEGDVLIGVENNLSNNIQVYKNLLQMAGKKVKLIVRRNNELVQTLLVIKDIK